ncbi:RidA family protein [Mesorhizobium sp. KR9-304]|uniref:RidA family protein n=1 Tax=Mesorhizobium sp. KR9-304 TaxID=3156614 RepID=UPI0032B3FF9E
MSARPNQAPVSLIIKQQLVSCGWTVKPMQTNTSPDPATANIQSGLPTAPPPAGNYSAVRVYDGWLYTSGQLSWRDGRIIHPGIIGVNVSVEQALEAAAIAATNLIAQLKLAVGDLDRVAACMRLTCHLACAPTFHDHPTVLDDASAVLVEHLGHEVGRHARLAYGSSSLPFNSPIEIEGIFRLRR